MKSVAILGRLFAELDSSGVLGAGFNFLQAIRHCCWCSKQEGMMEKLKDRFILRVLEVLEESPEKRALRL